MKYEVVWSEIVSAKNPLHAIEKAARNIECMPTDELAMLARAYVAEFQNATVSQRSRNRAARNAIARERTAIRRHPLDR